MKTTIISISGFAEAFESMFISKRTWTPQLGKEIREVCSIVEGQFSTYKPPKKEIEAVMPTFNKWLEMLLKMGRRHITVMRFIDIAIMTEGLHRAGQDDVDAHAKRFDNRIIRSSTRLATFDQDEFSDFYKDSVMTTDTMMKNLNVKVPEKLIEVANECFYTPDEYEDLLDNDEIPEMYKAIVHVWVKSPNGYILEEHKNNKDVKRGLYMLGIPSNFISKINLTEWAHVFQERNKDGGANPEVKIWAESVMEEITERYPLITRDYVLTVKN